MQSTTSSKDRQAGENSQELLVLKSCGLNDKEAIIYLALLRLGEASVVQLSTQSKIKRPTAYFTLEILINKGLVLERKNRRGRMFRAASPMAILQRSKDSLNLFELALPRLLNLSPFYSRPSQIDTFYGLGGIERGWRLCLEAKTDILFIADYTLSSGFSDQDLQRKITPTPVSNELADSRKNIFADRMRRGIWIRGIIPYIANQKALKKRGIDSIQKRYLSLKMNGSSELREYYFVSGDHFHMPVEITAFNDTVILISYVNMITTIIRDPNFYYSFRNIFKMAFEFAKLNERDTLRKRDQTINRKVA